MNFEFKTRKEAHREEKELPQRQHNERETGNAVARALAILETLVRENRALTVAQLSSDLSIPRATIFRIMKTLEVCGYVTNVDGKGGYVSGARVLGLGYFTDYLRKVRQLASPILFDLAKDSGFTVQLGALFEYEIMYIDQIQSSEGLSVVMPSERPFPVNLSAGGKAIVAHLPSDRLDELLRFARFAKNTPNTIVDKTQFRQELRRVKEQGFAYDNEEFARGVCCIASPVFDHLNRAIVSLGITGHSSEINEASATSLAEYVMSSAARLSRKLGYPIR